MLNTIKAKPMLLVGSGLLALVTYNLIFRFHPTPLMANDYVHGTWIGLCIAVELLGVILMLRAKNRRAA